MILHRLPVVAAVIAGLTVIFLSTMAMFTRLPPSVEEGRFLELTVRSVAKSPDLIDPGMLSIIIIVVSMLGLTILFAVEYLRPQARRKTASTKRLRAVDEIMRALEGDPE